MKKLALSIFALTLILASSCSHNTVNAIDEVNENMNLPFPLALAEKELKYDDEYERGEGFGGYTLCKEGMMLWVSGWPDVCDDYHVTEYRLTGKEYEIFGISVGNDLDDAVTVLTNHAYVRDETEEHNYGERAYIYKKNEQVRIMLHVDEDKNIYEIWATAITTNKDNVVF